ncbi:MAG TPA: hypothetical protein VFP76_00975 [Gemmatimonadota bacterium]|nr:hypothetical protein [Gemmatimonadota bacterium]
MTTRLRIVSGYPGLLLLLLASLATVGCAGDEDDRGADVGLENSTPERSRAPSETASREAPGRRSDVPSRDLLTGEYLAGTWCYSPVNGDGERGVYVFDKDGSYRVGVYGTPTDHQLEEREELETFWNLYGGPTEVEPDRFVVGRNEFRRAPC